MKGELENYMSHSKQYQYNRLYRIWVNMKSRCLNPNFPKYPRYGGRGITICEEWLDFSSFEKWALSNGYSEELTLDRKCLDGNYEPNNCHWISNFQQQSNKSDNHFVTCNGETHTLAEWSRILKVKYSTLVTRASRGWSDEKIILTPIGVKPLNRRDKLLN